MNEKGEKIQEQDGTVRTNCIDCLDRTNVTQVHGCNFQVQLYVYPMDLNFNKNY